MKRHRSSGQMIDFLEVKRTKHRVAIPQGVSWGPATGGTGVARLFLVIFLVHAAVVAAIIVHDSMDRSALPREGSSLASAVESPPREASLPPVAVPLSKLPPIEDCATYEWRSGDSIGSVARKLGVTEEVLIEMNLLDKGVQLEANSIIRYPRAPVERAQALVGNAAIAAPEEVQAKVSAVVRPAKPAEGEPLPAATAKPKELLVEASAPASEKGKVSLIAATIEESLAPTPLQPVLLPKASISRLPPAVLMVGPSPAQASEVAAVSKPSVESASIRAMPSDAQAADLQTSRGEVGGQVALSDEEVPKALAVTAEDLAALEAREPAASPALPAEHVVSQGDTFYSLAKRWGVSIKRLQAANPKVKPQALRAGMKLQVPHP